jgi:hypothetical protein
MNDNTTPIEWLRLCADLNDDGNREYDEEHELPGLLRKQAE